MRPLILSLPAELTIEIFRLVPSSPLRLPNPSRVTVPLVFGEVCREWRRISRATPELWSSLVIILDSAIKKPGRWRSAVGKLLSAWVDRSDPFPIHLAFTQRPNAIFSTPPLIIDTFIRAASRLGEFRIDYLPVAAVAEMFDTIYAPLRLLTRLSVRSMPSSTQADCLFRNLAHSPLLHDLTIAGDFTAHLPPSVSATSLTHFSAGGLTHSEAWQVLKSANHLVECLFDFRTGGYLPHEHQVLAHPNLRKLTVKNSFRSFSTLFFRYITTRRLTDLAVTIDTEYGALDLDTFFDFIQRSAFRLSHFYADVRGEVPLDAARLTRLLELLPDLTQLEYEAPDISTLVSLISPVRRGTRLLPCLQHLHLIPGQLLVDYLPVFVMLDARLRNDSESHCDPLVVFHLTLGHDVEAPSNRLHEWLEELRGNGLTIVVERHLNEMEE